MTEKEAIEKLKETQDSYLKDELDLAIETVLNLLERKNEEITKLKNNNKELLRKLRNRVKEVKKLTKYSLYKTEFSNLNKQLEKKDNKIALLEQVYKELQNDFDSFKKDKDISYLDGIHHKKLVEKSIGQMIDKPEECWFDIFEVKVIKNNKLYGVAINEDFVTLKQISDESPEECITVIAESPLSGTIYRYNSYGDKKWQLIGTMLGYA